MKISLKRALLPSLILPCVLGAQSASAVMIEEWGYAVDSTIADPVFSGSGGDIDIFQLVKADIYLLQRGRCKNLRH